MKPLQTHCSLHIEGIECISFRLNWLSIRPFYDPVYSLVVQSTNTTHLLSERVATNLSLQSCIPLLKAIFTPSLRMLIQQYFMSERFVVGVQNIRHLFSNINQKLHRDHNVGKRKCIVLAISLHEENVIDTIVCPYSHLYSIQPSSMDFNTRFPSCVLCSSAIIYDGYLVHGSQNSSHATVFHRLFIFIVVDTISESELSSIANLNGLGTTDVLHVQDI